MGLNRFSKFVFLFFSSVFFVPLAYMQLSFGALTNCAVGFGATILFCGAIFSLDSLLKNTSLKSYNALALGLFFGWIFSQILILIVDTLLGSVGLFVSEGLSHVLMGCLYLFSLYFGVLFTMRASEEIYLSIPFLRLKPKAQEKKDLLLEASALTDPRMIDLVTTGLFDHQLILPRFVMKQIYEMAESSSEMRKSKAKQALELIKKMEQTPSLGLRIHETEFPDLKEISAKLMRLARLLGADILTADAQAFELSSAAEPLRTISLHALAKALKPLTQSGEYLDVKVQRYGKEARQGVGYQEDGTMVVINGGAAFIGETIKAQVLSVKHTSAGRMIFSNAVVASSLEDPEAEIAAGEAESSLKNYFAL